MQRLELIPQTIVCEFCGKKTKKTNSQIRYWKHHFCSVYCRVKASEKKISVNCGFCKKTILRKKSVIKDSKLKKFFCNKKCFSNFEIHYTHITDSLIPSIIINDKSKRNHFRQRIRLLQKINPELKCENCGCDVISILEINHIFGGGVKELSKDYSAFRTAIMKGTRQTDDLELTCRVCNNLRYVKSKGINNHKVIWNDTRKIT